MNLSNICQDLVKRDEDILSAILFGSRARGDYGEKSDYDFMFITKSTNRDNDGESLIEQEYKKKISEKIKIDKDSIQISVLPLEVFKEEYRKGNTFTYCALRDVKILFSRLKLDFKKPTNFREYAIARLGLAERNIGGIEFSIKIFKKFKPGSFDIEDLGYSSMHICWAICLLNNFCPISKYTVLQECSRFFNEEEFKGIEKAYSYYADQNNREIEMETFVELFNILKNVLGRIYKEYGIKENEIKHHSKKA